MKNKSLMTAVALLITACTSNPPLDPSCGQVTFSVLSDFSSNKVGASDVTSLNYLLTNSHSVKSWHSACGANIVASPSQSFYYAEKNLNCRNLNLSVDGRVGNLVTCLTNNGKWTVIESDLKSASGGCKP